MSRFESSLNQKLAENLTEVDRAIVTLRISAYKARKGNLPQARGLIEDVRKRFSTAYDAQLFGYINFAEAICEYFEGEVNKAIIKIQRSRALCLSLPSGSELPALVLAWEANFFRVLKNWKNVEGCLASIFGDSRNLSNEVKCRANLVLADCFQEVERYDLSDRFYSRARVAALEYGDESLVGAILYNRAAIRVFNLRLSEILNDALDINGCRIAIEAASAENYSAYTGDVSLPGIYDLLGGQLNLLKEEFVAAIRKLEGHSSQSLGRQWPAVELVRRADLLRARVAVGMASVEEAKSAVADILKEFSPTSNQGAVAISASSLQRIFRDVEGEMAARLAEIALKAHALYEEDRDIQRKMLQRLIVEIELD